MVQKFITYPFKAIRELKYIMIPFWSTLVTKIYFVLNGVAFSSLTSLGIPALHVSLHGRFTVGENFKLCNWIGGSATGYSGRCKIIVRNGAMLTIGNSVGLSIATIVCHEKITIHDNVLIGVGVHIFDTDFHSIEYQLRTNKSTDIGKTKPVVISENVFIGAHTIVLKGVTIGKNSVIGAGSVVTKDLPDNVIAAGNPCSVIKKLVCS